MRQRVRSWRRSTVLLVASGLVAAAVFAGRSVALANHNFSDVPNSAGYHDFVDFLVQNGITSGCGSGVFCPNNAVTRGQMAIFLEKLAIALGNCPLDSVKIGPTCIDKYEASVWEVPPGSAGLIQRIKAGTVTLAELQAGAFQRGATSDNFGAGCPDTGNGCVNVYAVSIAGVTPSRVLTWVQAAAAARNSGKRLPTNAEWQAAAFGTPEASCRISGGSAVATGSMAGCVSNVGAFDMVGNVWEWVAEWMARSTTCASWQTLPVADFQCLAGAATTGPPGALLRGGHFDSAGGAGVFAVTGLNSPTLAQDNVGFRAAR
jgi:hypothetical protein